MKINEKAQTPSPSPISSTQATPSPQEKTPPPKQEAPTPPALQSPSLEQNFATSHKAEESVPTMQARGTTLQKQGFFGNLHKAAQSLQDATSSIADIFIKQKALSPASIQAVKESGDTKQIAQTLHDIILDRDKDLIPDDKTRIQHMQMLLDGMDAKQVDQVCHSYIERYGKDPQVDIRSWDILQPLKKTLSPETEFKMTALLTGAQHKETATQLASLFEKAQQGKLTQEDRKSYYAMMPMVGLWNAPLRPDAKGLDAMERKILSQKLQEVSKKDISLDEAMKTIEAQMPKADLSPQAPRDRSIAVIMSSSGAQWQEFADWLKVTEKAGYHVQIFTPEGRPVSMQRDSLSLSPNTAKVGFGCPPHLDPRGETGEIAKKYFANTASAKDFDASQFGAVYAVGGLGFNEDVAPVTPTTKADGKQGAHLELHPNIKSMMQAAVDERLPAIAVCHGPTIFAGTTIEINGVQETLNKGIKTASLPPLEGYVGATGRKESQFTYDTDTQGVLSAAGGKTNTIHDLANLSRVVVSHKDGMDIISGPGPQAAKNLGDATIEALQRRWH